MSWEDVKKEMINDKGVAAAVVEKIGSYVVKFQQINASRASDLIRMLSSDDELMANESACFGVDAISVWRRTALWAM